MTMDGDMMMKILTMVGLVGYLRYKDKDIMAYLIFVVFFTQPHFKAWKFYT